MATLLHENATVLCLHGGQARPMTVSTRVKVNNQAIVTQQVQYQISGCGLPSQSGGPCTMAQFVQAALRVKSENQPVLLMDSQAVCTPPGTPLNVVTTQTRVTGT